jgi:hypothetical protein
MYGNSVSEWQSRKAFGPNVKAQFSGEQLYTVEGKDSSLISGEQQPSPASVRKGKKKVLHFLKYDRLIFSASFINLDFCSP